MRQRAVLIAATLSLLATGAPPPLAGAAAGTRQSGDHRLRYVGTERQLGPVAYRDPLGVPSPDGRWLATHVGLHLRVAPLAGGPSRELGQGRLRRLFLAWRPDSSRLVAREANRERTWFDWAEYDVETGTRRLLWSGRTRFEPPSGPAATRADLLELAFAADGAIAGLVRREGGRQVWMFGPDGAVTGLRDTIGPWSSLAWGPDGSLACIDGEPEPSLLSRDCGRTSGDRTLGEAHGPLAVGADGAVYFGRPNGGGTLDLWRVATDGDPERLTRFTRDTYAPHALRDGRVLFKLQEYLTTIALVDADGGSPSPLTTFQSETPSWDPRGETVAFTFGSWRRAIDDARYPDIAQHLGTVSVSEGMATEPGAIVRQSYSEDQGMHWSPDGRWIVLHSHAHDSDDIWLQPADGSTQARPITHGGNETGWPRFSPDGRWIVYPTDIREPGADRLGRLYLLEFDGERGDVIGPQREITIEGFDGQATFAEFGPDSRTLYFEAMHDVGERAIWSVDREGGRARLVHRWRGEQWFTGIAVAPDGDRIAYVAPAPDGHMQLFTVSTTSGAARQITFDATDKTQPAWSPRGDRIAFTVFRYLAHFWLLEPDYP